MCYQNKDLQQINPEAISSTCLVSLQQPLGILLLEEGLLHTGGHDEPPPKRPRVYKEIPPDTNKWIHLARYHSVSHNTRWMLHRSISLYHYTLVSPRSKMMSWNYMYSVTYTDQSPLNRFSCFHSTSIALCILQTLQVSGGLWCCSGHFWQQGWDQGDHLCCPPSWSQHKLCRSC